MLYQLAEAGAPFGRKFEADSRKTAHDRAARKGAPQCAELSYDGKVLRILPVDQR